MCDCQTQSEQKANHRQHQVNQATSIHMKYYTSLYFSPITPKQKYCEPKEIQKSSYSASDCLSVKTGRKPLRTLLQDTALQSEPANSSTLNQQQQRIANYAISTQQTCPIDYSYLAYLPHILFLLGIPVQYTILT